MNAPTRHELFFLEDGEKLVQVTEDSKIPNAVTLRVAKQDHTLANLVRSELLNAPAVLFAGYKVPHPLEPYFVLRVQTDGSITPVQAIEQACESLIRTASQLEQKFEREFTYKEDDSHIARDDPYSTSAAAGSRGWGSNQTGRDYLDF